MKTPLFLTIFLLTGIALGARTWTNTEGKSITADLVSFDGSTVILKLGNGNKVPLSLDKLCPEDAAFLKKSAEDERTAIDNPDKWPDFVQGPIDFKLKEVKARKANVGKSIYQTKHFKFVCDTPLADDAQEAVGRLYECTWTAIRAMPLPIPRVKRQSYLFDAVLTKDMASYRAAGGPDGSAGVFTAQTLTTGKKLKENDIKEDKTIVPYPGLGMTVDGKLNGEKIKNHVLAHEITHQMTVGLFDSVIWINEGFADYVGSIPYDGKQFDFTGAFKAIVARGKQYSPMQLPYTFEEFLTMGQNDFYDRSGGNGHRNYTVATLCVAFFFHLDGKDGIKNFTDYMNSLAKKGKHPLRELLNKRKIGELEELFTKEWKDQGVVIAFKAKAS
jgi:hypothetical protein